MKSGEKPPEDKEPDEDRRLDEEHLHVGAGHVGVPAEPRVGSRVAGTVTHRAALRSARRCSAEDSAPVACFHHIWSSSSWPREAAAARVVCSGAGPPRVRRTLTKCRGLRISASAASEYVSGAPSNSFDAAARSAESGPRGSRSRAAIRLAVEAGPPRNR